MKLSLPAKQYDQLVQIIKWLNDAPACAPDHAVEAAFEYVRDMFEEYAEGETDLIDHVYTIELMDTVDQKNALMVDAVVGNEDVAILIEIERTVDISK